MMPGRDGEPPLAERLRMPLRIAAILAGYAVYRFFERPIVAGVMLGFGFMFLSWAVIERYTTWRGRQLQMMLVAQGILGTGLLALGAFLAAR